jgi:hypothetical protein
MKNIFTILTLLIIMIAGCEPDIENFEPKPGDADFSNYVAVGNSLTAGFMNGELYKKGQKNSFPSILANTFKEVGGGNFKQPLMKDNLGFGNKKVLGYQQDCLGEASLAPIPAGGTPDQENTASIADEGPFNNMGVPGAKSFHLLYPGYGALNPYFNRFASDPATTTVISDAMQVQPTFFTLWTGNNDVLTYAMAGAESDSITTQQMFSQSVGGILQTLTSNGAKGAIANVPDITSAPYFTTIPYNPVTLNETEAAQLNAAYESYNTGATGMGLDSISFKEGKNAMVIEDDDPAYDPLGNIRQIESNELVLLSLPQDSIKCAGWGTQKPVPDEYVLDATEIDEITTAIEGYNQTLNSLASQHNLAYVKISSLMEDAKRGIRIDGVEYTNEFITGGLFSLDGLHLTGQGYAIVANEFLEAINNQYDASLPLVNVIDYPGIQFP